MAVALLEHLEEGDSLLHATRSDLLCFVERLESGYLTLSQEEVSAALVEIEQLSKVVDHLQTLAARAAEDHKLAIVDGPEPHKNTAEYLRARTRRTSSSDSIAWRVRCSSMASNCREVATVHTR